MKDCPYCGEAIQDAARKCRHCGEFLTTEGRRPRRRSQGRRRRKQSGSNTWIIVAAIGGVGALLVIPCLIALLLPAVQQAREAARRSACKNNLKMIGLALHNYHDAYDSFPPAYVADANGRPMHSWRVLILPFIDKGLLYERYDFSQPWDSPANLAVGEMMPEVYRCPSSDQMAGNVTNYAAVFGPDSIFRGAEPVGFRDITDGAGVTLMIGEASGAGISWTQPVDIDVSNGTNLGDPNGFSSEHVGGVQFLMADGAVRFINADINLQVLESMFTRDGGEAVNAF